MFSLNHLIGDTYYIDAPTNIGVYKLSNRDCILIDTCHRGSMTERLLNTLSHYNLKVKSIVHTHAHIDHFGGTYDVKSVYECSIAAPRVESLFIESPEMSNLFIYNAPPFSSLQNRYPNATKVEHVFDEGCLKLENIIFNTLSLKGHSLNQMGIVTPDNVIFTGDAYLDVDELQQIKLLYNYDIRGVYNSLQNLLTTDYNIYVPSHGKPSQNINETLKYNIKNLEENTIGILSLFQNKPLSLDEVVSYLVNKYNVTHQVPQYYIAQACITSVLSYLEVKGLLELQLENGLMKYSIK